MVHYHLKQAVKRLKYFGYKHKCPICNSRLNTFMPSGLYEKRPNSKCPICNSLERHRQLWLILNAKGYLQNKTILHFAPEPCLKIKLSKIDSIEYRTSEYDINSISDFHYDIKAINAPDSSYDLIICSHVLEHIDNDMAAMEELYRILKNNGIALVQVPIQKDPSKTTYENEKIISEEERIYHFGQFDHVRIYGLDIVNRFRSAGFCVTRVDLTEAYSEKEAAYLGLVNYSGVRDYTFICTKANRNN